MVLGSCCCSGFLEESVADREEGFGVFISVRIADFVLQESAASFEQLGLDSRPIP